MHLAAEQIFDPACWECRAALEARFDGVADGASPGDHLESCPACREYAAELDDIRHALRALPVLPLPHAVLQRILQNTVQAPARSARRWLVGLAAAAAVTLAVALPMRAPRGASGEMDACTQQAVDEANLVLGWTVQTMQRVQEAAVDEVLVQHFPSALLHVLSAVQSVTAVDQ